MKAQKKFTPNIQLVMISDTATRTYCYWCGQALRVCGMCRGTGEFKAAICKPCKGLGLMCPTHESDWE